MAVISGTGSVELPQGHVLDGIVVHGAEGGVGSTVNLLDLDVFTELSPKIEVDGDSVYIPSPSMVSGKTIFKNDGGADRVTISYYVRNGGTNTGGGVRFKIWYTDGTSTYTDSNTRHDEEVYVSFTTSASKTVDRIAGFYNVVNPTYIRNLQIQSGANGTRYIRHGCAALLAQGKNLADMLFTTAFSAIGNLTVEQDGSEVSIAGTAGGSTYVFKYLKNRFTLPAGTYTMSIDVDGACPRMFVSFDAGTSFQFRCYTVSETDKRYVNTVTLENPVTITRMTFEGFTAGGEYDCTVKIQLERGDAATGYEPYDEQLSFIDLGGNVLGASDALTIGADGHATINGATDLGYVKLPDVRGASTLSVIADVEPEIEVSTSEYSIAGGGASMNGRNLLRFTGYPTYAGVNSAANLENGWCTWLNTTGYTVERTEEGIKFTAVTASGGRGFVIPLAADGILHGGSGEVLTLSFQYRGSIGTSQRLYLMAKTGGNAYRFAKALTASETEWQTFTETFYFPSIGTRESYAILFPYTDVVDAWFEVKDGTMKLEYGTAATPWRPAPEDLATPSDVVYASEGVDLGDTSGLANGISALDGRMTAAEADIDTLDGSIALKANASDVYTKQESTALLEVKANKATLTSEINASADTVKISADRVNIEGAAIFTGSGRLSQSSLDGAYDVNGAASTAVGNLTTDLASASGTTVINGGHIATDSLTVGHVSGLQGTLDGKASTASVANAAKRTYVSIRATAIDYAADTATLEATLYIDGVKQAASAITGYSWLKDGVAMSGETASTLSVTTAKGGLGHAYSCTIEY